MKVVVLGGSGATGKEVVRELMSREVALRIVVRESAQLPEDIVNSTKVEVIRGSISTYTCTQMQQLIDNCDAVVSCLGHNISCKGMFGKPRTLVHDTIQTVCNAVKQSATEKIKLILMSTSGYTNVINGEKRTLGENIVNSLLYTLLPPHKDNVLAGNFLTKSISSTNATVEWVAVRPDSLINSDAVSPYHIEASPVRSPIFNAGTTSRINVAHFMAELLTDEKLWQQWKYQTPVIYNEA